MKIEKLRLRKVYKEERKTNLLDLVNKSGVYVIIKDKQILYVGHSTYNLYKTITRHFQIWKSSQIVTTYPQNKEYKIKIYLCSSNFAPKLEILLLKKLQPKDNPKKLQNLYTEKEINTIKKIEQINNIDIAPF
jgi:hypothetical protein